MPVNVNEKLTEAARRGARGHTEAGAFNELPPDKQQALITSIMQDRGVTEEIVRSSLLATNAADLEDMLNAMGETGDDTSKEQQLHTGNDA